MDYEKIYEGNLLYCIKSSARYIDVIAAQYFKHSNIDISPNEFFALQVILKTNGCCQRDLAKIILMDRSNAGKIAKKLEEKKLIKIETKSKNNKPINILTVSKKGEELILELSEKIGLISQKVHEEMTAKRVDTTIDNLKHFIKIVNQIAQTDI